TSLFSLEVSNDNSTRSRGTQSRRRERCIEEAARAWRSRSDTDCVCGWLRLGRHCRKTWNIASLFLASRYFTLLHSAGRRRHLSEQTDAVGRWNLPVGKTRF